MKRDTLQVSRAIYRLTDHDPVLHNVISRLVLTHLQRLDPSVRQYVTIGGSYGVRLTWSSPVVTEVWAATTSNGVLVTIQGETIPHVTEVVRTPDEATDILYDYFLRLTQALSKR